MKAEPDDACTISDLVRSGNVETAVKTKPSPEMKESESEPEPICLEGHGGHDQESQQRRQILLQKEILEGLSCFDQSLKLKIQMNIDTIQQDMAAWKEKKMLHIAEVQGSTKNKDQISKSELQPDFEKYADPELAHMIGQLNDILMRIQVSATHHKLMMPINEKD